jgi:branched-chain amino acid aminotransferase
MAEYAFFRGGFVPIEQANVNIRTHALNYGTGCFAGIRGYWNDEQQQLYLFRLPDHFRRFLQSCKLLMIELPYSVQELCDITVELARRQGAREDTYFRPLAYKSSEVIGVRLHDLEAEFAMFCVPFGKYIQSEEGARATISSWRRLDDNMIPPRGKITGAYASSAIIKTEAMLNGYDEAIVLDQNGHISEGSAENIFIVRDGTLITPPITENILEGITRRTMMELAANELGVETVERPVDRTELYICEEAFYCGTGVQMAAIVEVDHRPVGDGRQGPISTALRKLYFDVVRGKEEKYRHWCTPVYPPSS